MSLSDCLSVSVSVSVALLFPLPVGICFWLERDVWCFVCVCRGSVVSRRTKQQQGNNETKAFDVVVAAAVGYSLPCTWMVNQNLFR